MLTPTLIISILGLVVALVGMIVLTPRMLSDNKDRKRNRSLHIHVCPNCQQHVSMTPEGMRHLDTNDSALVIRNFPDAPAYDLAEIRCPECNSTLVFRVDEWPPVYLAANILEGHTAKNSCTQCRTPLLKPQFPVGEFDHDTNALPRLPDNIGLICSRCNAVNCLVCVKDATRNRTADGSLLCPRCYRGPVDKVHHF